MSFQMNSTYDYHEICEELGIPFDKFIDFIRKEHVSENPESNLTVAIPITEAIELYLLNLQLKVDINRRSKETYTTYRSFLLNFCDFLENKYPNTNLSQLNEIHLDKYLKKIQPRKGESSVYTANTYTGILRNFIKHCHREKWIDHDFRSRFEWEKRILLPRYIPDEQMDVLLRESVQMINGYRNHAILSVLVGTGLRIRELTCLQIKDIDFNRKVIFIQKGKGSKERYVPLYPEVEQIILDYLNITGVKEPLINREGYVFVATDHDIERKKMITRNAIEKMLKRLCKRAGLHEEFTPHALRHTFAVRCLKNGMRLEYLSQILGHTNINTTNIYLQLLPNDLGKMLTDKFPFPFQDLLFRSLGVD
ncbi:tyrosine-type recombinase/integrase [Paenibacillus sp. GCM10023248]|uniref:tyrosine-type recombinase/integrase n=1 Tax=unclassified Paenibacillus TaxID=185978 RepID=UPI002378BDBF|nr:tyrosine-type recombinase/integrase [Paenibacillus sp. MAHUQ-63]MDD9271455.1 tyrosine-type recombinase/integrase [Paenibacillus sp. MAHUQ-63]